MSSAQYTDYDYKPSLLDRVKPKRRKKKIQKAIDYFWGNGLLYRIIKSKVDLTISGFKVTHNDKKINRKYSELNKKIDVDAFAKRLLFQYFTIGEYYPFSYWRNGEPTFLTLLNPELVTVESALGEDFIYMKPSTSIKKILLRDDESSKKLKKMIPRKYIKKWSRGKEAYLSEANRYSNLRQYHEQYAHLPVEPIFNDLQLMETLQEADYATARKLRQLILHVKVGNKDFNQGRPVKKEIVKKLKENFEDKVSSRMMEMFTQYFVDMEYVHPDIEVFSSEKYQGPRERIVEWSNMDAFLSNNTSFSEASEKVKALREEIFEARSMVKKTLDNFYEQYAKENDLSYYKGWKTPKVLFDKTPLMDQDLLFKIRKNLYRSGLLSIESFMDLYGFDSEKQIEKKIEEQENQGEIYPLYESEQGLLLELFQEKGVISDNDNSNGGGE